MDTWSIHASLPPTNLGRRGATERLVGVLVKLHSRILVLPPAIALVGAVATDDEHDEQRVNEELEQGVHVGQVKQQRVGQSLELSAVHGLAERACGRSLGGCAPANFREPPIVLKEASQMLPS